MYKLYVLLILSFSLTTCDKNQISEIKLEEEPEPIAYRLTQYNYYSENELIQSLSYSYNDESLVKWSATDVLSDETDSVVFTYEGNWATGYEYYKGELDYKLDFLIENGLTTLFNSYRKQDDSSWGLSWRQTLHYSGKNLNELITEYDLLYPSMASKYKDAYVFREDTLTETVSYHWISGGWEPFEKLVYAYSSGNIAEIVQYDEENDDWFVKGKYSYAYSEEVLKSITDSEWNRYEEIWEVGDTMTFQYDANGNISVIEYGDDDREEFVYEPGKGNLSNFLFSNGFTELGLDILKSGNLNNENHGLMERNLPFVITNPRHPFYIGNTVFYEH